MIIINVIVYCAICTYYTHRGPKYHPVTIIKE